MQTGIVKWSNAQEGLGAIQLNTIAAILSIFATAAILSGAITVFANR